MFQAYIRQDLLCTYLVKYHLINVGVNFNLDLIERLLVRLVFFNHCVADVETGTKGEFQLYIHI